MISSNAFLLELITRDSLSNALQACVGEYPQRRLWIEKPEHIMLYEIQNRIDEERMPPKRSEYYEGRISTMVKCNNIELTEFCPPRYAYRITCSSDFCPYAMLNNINTTLDTASHVTSLIKEQEGPIRLSDCLQYHQIHHSDIVEAIKTHKHTYAKWFKYAKQIDTRTNCFQSPW